MTEGPAPAGWYPDPAGSEGWRWWDGRAWTAATRPPEAPAPAAEGARGPRRTWPLLVAGVAAAALLAVALVLAILPQRGAGGPLAAAEQLVEAIDGDDLGAALRLLPPDEVDWLRGLVEHLPDAPEDDEALAGLRLEAEFGEARTLVDGLAVVSVRSITVEAVDAGLITDVLGLRPGEREHVDLRDDPDAELVVVERGGRWFVSPLGTGLEAESRARGLGGATPARGRQGAGDPQQAVERGLEALAQESLPRLVDVIDPDELRVLDHYGPLVEDASRGAAAADDVRVRAGGEVDGASVRLRSLELLEGGWHSVVDVEAMCVEENGERACLADAVEESVEPWHANFFERLVVPAPHPVVVETVEHDGRSYVSLEGTVDATVVPLLEGLDDHDVAGLVAPWLSPVGVETEARTGVEVTVPLEGNWNALTLIGEDGSAGITACPPADAGLGQAWAVAGQPVVVEPSPLPTAAPTTLLVGVSGREPVEEVTVLLDEAPCGATDEPGPLGADQVWVEAGDLYFVPDLVVAGAGSVDVVLENVGATDHALAIEGFGRVAAAGPGSAASGSVDLGPGEHVFYCDLPGHREAGMEGTLEVR